MKTNLKQILIFILLLCFLIMVSYLLLNILDSLYSDYIFNTESRWENADAEIELSIIQNEACNKHSIIGKYKGNDICRSYINYVDAVTGEYYFDAIIKIVGFNKMSLEIDYVEDNCYHEPTETIILRRKHD